VRGQAPVKEISGQFSCCRKACRASIRWPSPPSQECSAVTVTCPDQRCGEHHRVLFGPMGKVVGMVVFRY